MSSLFQDCLNNPKKLAQVGHRPRHYSFKALSLGWEKRDSFTLYIEMAKNSFIQELFYECAENSPWRPYLEYFARKTVGGAPEIVWECDWPEDWPKPPTFFPLLQWSFQKAYEVYTGSFSSLEKLDCLLCRCTGVTQDEVERYFKGNAQASLLQVTDQLKVGGLCGSCMGEVRAIKGQFSQQKFGREYAGGKTTAEFLLEIEEFFIRWLEKNRITGRFQFLSLVDFTLEMSWSGDKFNRKDLKHDFLKQTGIYLDFLLSP